MSTTSWNPKEAGKLANANDQEIARQQQEQVEVLRRATGILHNRKQRAHSVIGPALQRIKLHTQQMCAAFNTQIADPRNYAKAQDYNYGLGIDNVPHSFAVVRNSMSAKFTSTYDSNWRVDLILSDGTSRFYEVVEESGAAGVTLKSADQNFTEEEVATEACRFVCQ
jgi:hypothetical protein